MTTQEQAVLEANQAFYQAFSEQDTAGMEVLWSSVNNIAVIHPGWPPLLGQRAVRASWKRILEGGGTPGISCVDASANINGNTAIVICTEVLVDVELVATNIFVLENTVWKMIHHQAGPLPASMDSSEAGVLH